VDVYTLLLFFALVAIILACVCLWLEMQDYSSPNQKPWEGAPAVYYQIPAPEAGQAVSLASTQRRASVPACFFTGEDACIAAGDALPTAPTYG
jgi:hypothetical protein